MSKHAPVAKATDYMLARWNGFTRFLFDDRISLTNNAAERALRGIALARRSWMFAGGGRRSPFIYGLIMTCKLNDVDPQARVADLLASNADLPQHRPHELLPWNWRAALQVEKAA